MKIIAEFVIILFLSVVTVHGQEKAIIFGKVTKNSDKPIELVNVVVSNLDKQIGAVTDIKGSYSLEIPASTDLIIVYSCVGFESKVIRVNLLPGSRKEINNTLIDITTELTDVIIKGRHIDNTTFIRIDPKEARIIPTPAGGIESLIIMQPGVVTTSELSSQYSVRGGNFDENLVYVNDIEIYRPFLVRSGQQEGLSFINPDLVSSIQFSAGGFDAKYGDKMSSALDIRYKKPTEFGGSASLSFLGGSIHLEDKIGKKLTYLVGLRQKSNQYLLKGMETQGEYNPSFTDIQTLWGYDVSKKLEIFFLGNYARNSYQVIPENRETNFGTINEAYRFKIYFDGQEVDMFRTYFGALSAVYKPKDSLRLKFIVSAFSTAESETFDIQGQYWLYQLEADFGGDDFGQEVFTRGVGTFLNHARNYLNATVYNFQLKGSLRKPKNNIEWGVKFQHEVITDQISEWDLLDSAGFSLPNPRDSIGYTNPIVQPDYLFELDNVLKSANDLRSNRYSGFVQNRWDITSDSAVIAITAGIRANYWDLNNQAIISPRAKISYKPNWKKEMLFRFSTGYYYQPPFYKELRDLEGELHTDLKAQKSIHFVLGTDYYFESWNRPFKFVAEIYYKYLDNIIPYEIENVRIKYYAHNNAHGYATGIDLRVNGEVVKGVESWVSLSFMKTEEDIEGDYYIDTNGRRIEPGYIPRPTDQRFTFNLFFQDYFPNNPTYKMHLNLIYGSKLPFGPPDSPKYKHILRIPPYRRVDIGFSKQIVGEGASLSSNKFFRNIKSMWISLEVFNLLQIKNTISYIWVSDIDNRRYAVPNHLTPRQVNLKLITRF